MPLAKAQALTIGATSYNGSMFYGLNADRDAMPDIDDLASKLVESLDELVQAEPPRPRRPRAQNRATP